MPYKLSISSFTFIEAMLTFQHAALERGECVLCVQGKSLTAGVRQVHADFQAAFGELQKVEYDVLQLEGSEWPEDHGRFRHALRELEKRLSQIIVLVSLPPGCTTDILQAS